MSCIYLADASRRGDGLLLDALPYGDLELEEPGMRDLVNSLILEEMSRYQAPDYTLEMQPLPVGPDGTFDTVPSSVAVRKEITRFGIGTETQRIMESNEFPCAPSGTLAEDVSVWETNLSKARIAVEAQALFAINMELSAKYSVDAWKAHISQLDSQQSVMRARVQELEAQITATNAARKSSQEGQCAKIRALTKRSTETAANNFAVALACDDAGREIKRLRRLAERAGLGVGIDGES